MVLVIKKPLSHSLNTHFFSVSFLLKLSTPCEAFQISAVSADYIAILCKKLMEFIFHKLEDDPNNSIFSFRLNNFISQLIFIAISISRNKYFIHKAWCIVLNGLPVEQPLTVTRPFTLQNTLGPWHISIIVWCFLR